MTSKVPIGIDDFKEIIEEDYYYLDKSLLIKRIIDEPAKVLLLPRPRRFGKSLNLSMLHYFFAADGEDNAHLFTNLKIAEEKEYLAEQGAYPVIKLDFKGTKAENWQVCFANLKQIIAQEYKKHRYLLEGDCLADYEQDEYKKIIQGQASKAVYRFSIENLSYYLNKYYQSKVIILIDEYDEPIQSGYQNQFYDQVIEFMRGLLTRVLKGNQALKQGILTGILRIAKESIFSGLNNLSVSTLLDKKYDTDFGLLPQEVEQIFTDYNLEAKLEEVKDWYNGYYFGEHILYNPWSVINCIYNAGELKPYWVNTSSNEIIRDLITSGSGEVKQKLEALIKNQSITEKVDENIVFGEIDNQISSLWSFLLLSGYLRAEEKTRKEGRLYCKLTIPNQEVKYIYEEIITDWFSESMTDQKLKLMLTALVSGEVATFEEIFQEFVINSMSHFDLGGEEPEKVYHVFVLGLLLNLRGQYQIKSNRESGYGRYDVMLIPEDKDKLGIIIEFKKANSYRQETLTEAVRAALEQIETKNYQQELIDRGVNDILKLGIAFSGKQILVKAN